MQLRPHARRIVQAIGQKRYCCGIAGRMEAKSYQTPVLGMDAHGSRFGKAAPFCKSSIEILSGERMKAIAPSRGGRLMVTPALMSLSHSA
jgi:hypothetical protein